MKSRRNGGLGRLKKQCLALWVFLLSACSVVQFRPVETIDQVRAGEGYRLQQAMDLAREKENFIVMMISGGGTRAAAFGYGILEALDSQPIYLHGRRSTWLDHIDVVYGVSGGAVLAAYLALHGRDTIPDFENRFLKQNFQRQISRQILSFANMPRLRSPEFGRGDLLQEQFENTLFGKATFGDLAQRRRGPFAVISATDMTAGRRIDFTQEYFDVLCLNLSTCARFRGCLRRYTTMERFRRPEAPGRVRSRSVDGIYAGRRAPVHDPNGAPADSPRTACRMIDSAVRRSSIAI